jgi:DNA-binding response OmpR family regulator
MPKILIIDDDEKMLHVVRLALVGAGYDVRTARNGREGERLLAEFAADLILTDLVMPDKEGIEFIIDRRRVDPQQRIIAMSGAGGAYAQDYLCYARALGADATLAKPFRLERLLQVVEQVLREQRRAGSGQGARNRTSEVRS